MNRIHVKSLGAPPLLWAKWHFWFFVWIAAAWLMVWWLEGR